MSRQPYKIHYNRAHPGPSSHITFPSDTSVPTPDRYRLFVRNVGIVGTYNNPVNAVAEYKYYVRLSKSNTGCAAGESVVLMCDEMITHEYWPDEPDQ